MLSESIEPGGQRYVDLAGKFGILIVTMSRDFYEHNAIYGILLNNGYVYALQKLVEQTYNVGSNVDFDFVVNGSSIGLNVYNVSSSVRVNARVMFLGIR